MSRKRERSTAPLAAVLGLTVATTVGVAALAPAPAQAAGSPSLVVSTTRLSGDKPTTITVQGRNYLVPPHKDGAQVFGGVYVFFGWVRPGGGWGPSKGGSFGATYAYPGDAGGATDRDDGSGRVRLVSFTDGGTSGGATAFHMDEAGNWPKSGSKLTIRVPGAVFTYTDDKGASRTIDCRTTQCGIFTIGAHGKASATNEVFRPLTFTGTASSGGTKSGGTSSGSKSGTKSGTKSSGATGSGATVAGTKASSGTKAAGSSGTATSGSDANGDGLAVITAAPGSGPDPTESAPVQAVADHQPVSDDSRTLWAGGGLAAGLLIAGGTFLATRRRKSAR
jgi:hypothetical protein